MSSQPKAIHHLPIPWLLIFSMILFFAGCASTPDTTDSPSPDLYSNDEQIFVGDSIEMSYDPNVIMKRAESFFEKESYAEAIVEYKHFLNLHQNHTLAPYAQYKIGVSHYKQFRTVDRDPEPLKKAITGFEKLLAEYPANRYEAEAKDTIRTCKEQLVQRHLMVGEFYLKREAYLAAAHRYEKIIKEFPELGTTDEAMFHLAKTYQDLGIEEWSQDWLVALMKQYPESSYYSSAQTMLASLHEEHPTLLASLPENPLVPSIPSMETIVPQISDNTIVTTADSLPVDSPTQTTVATSNERATFAAPCTIGMWCDSQSVSSIPVSTPPPPTPAKTQGCKTGEWC